jgi:hypothetical protein
MDYRHISVNHVDGVTVVRFLDLVRAVQCKEAIHEIGEKLKGLIDQMKPCSLVLDFENKEFAPNKVFDSQLIGLHLKLTRRSGAFRLCNVPALLIEHYRITRLAEIFSRYNSLEDALAACTDSKPMRSDINKDDR